LLRFGICLQIALTVPAQTFDGIKLATNSSKEVPVKLTVGVSGLTIDQAAPLWGKPDPNALKIEVDSRVP
jgi:hypothetical protein